MDTSRIRGPVRRPMRSAGGEDRGRCEDAVDESVGYPIGAADSGLQHRLFRLRVVEEAAEDSWVPWRADAPSLAGCGGLGGPTVTGIEPVEQSIPAQVGLEQLG